MTRRVSMRVGEAIHCDRRVLRMIAAHKRDPELEDCTPECIAGAAIGARHAWTWAALSLLRWLCEPWPARCARCGAEGARGCPDCGEPFCTVHLGHPRICGEGPGELCRECSLASWRGSGEPSRRGEERSDG